MSKQTKPEMIYLIRRDLTDKQKQSIDDNWWNDMQYIAKDEYRGNIAAHFERITFTEARKFVTVHTLRKLREWSMAVDSNKHRYSTSSSKIYGKNVTNNELDYSLYQFFVNKIRWEESGKRGWNRDDIPDDQVSKYLLAEDIAINIDDFLDNMETWEPWSYEMVKDRFCPAHIEMAVRLSNYYKELNAKNNKEKKEEDKRFFVTHSYANDVKELSDAVSHQLRYVNAQELTELLAQTSVIWYHISKEQAIKKYGETFVTNCMQLLRKTEESSMISWWNDRNREFNELIERVMSEEPKGTNPLKGIEAKLGELYGILTEFKTGDDSIGNIMALVKNIHG